MNPSARSFVRSANVLVALGIGCLTFRLCASDATPNAAEKAWKELLAAEESFEELHPPSLDQKVLDRFQREYFEKAGKLADRFKKYQVQFPTSTNASEAWENWMDLLNTAAHGSATRRAELEKAEQEYLADPKLSRVQRETIHDHQVDRLTDVAERERLLHKLKADHEVSTGFFCQHMLDTAEFAEYPQSRQIVDEILKLTGSTPTWKELHAAGYTSTNEHTYTVSLSGEKATRALYHEQALELKKALDRIGHPLQIRFTALDGTKVDLKHYRGKVVLLEFWATWCAPCLAGIPEVKTVWKKLHQHGFEVIGISYDNDRDTLEKFVHRNDLPWPQFFDPAGKGAPLVQSLGQPGPPAYWLIDKQGLVSDLNAHNHLETKVKRLLEEKGTHPESAPNNQ